MTLTFEELKKAIKEAKKIGCSCYIVINGEYYDIQPETIDTETETQAIDDLPF